MILIISAIMLFWAVLNNDTGFLWRHFIGLFFLTFTVVGFIWRHQIGVIILGLTLIIGLIGLLSFDPSITTTTFGLGDSDSGITIFRGQPIYILWLTLYFVLSGRHFVGIATKKYWEDLLTKK